MREVKKINVRMTCDEYARIANAAREKDTSVNRYFVDSALKNIAASVQQSAIEKVVSGAIDAQTEMLAGALSRLADEHAEQDAALRESIRSALQKVLERVEKGAKK